MLFRSVISRAVFVVKIVIIEKEMHSHKLSAMADNYPADWCINLSAHMVLRSNGQHTNFFIQGIRCQNGQMDPSCPP